jgi:pimeloyl-ACP methyl ester carboxylesterase
MNFHRTRLLRLLTAATVSMIAGCAGTQPPPREPTAYTLTGSGTPILVFQSGLGDDRSTWKDMLPALSAHYTVFVHDRPGTEGNSSVAGPRDPCTLAAEQRAALRSAGLAPPYVLVGHSLGGLYQYVYASLYPQEVSGFVLVDPTHPRNWAEIQRQLPATATLLKGIKTVAFSEMERREFDDQARCLDRPEFARPPGVPGRVLVAGRPRASDPEDYEALHLSLAREWPGLTGVSGVEMVWDAAHYIHHERPERVIAAIRRTASPRACADGCEKPQHRLAGIEIGGHAAFDIAFGETRRNQIETVLGQPRKTYAPLDAQGDEVRVYHRKPDKAHAAVSFIPVLGDLVDAVETVLAMREWQELVVEYDASGVVRRAGLRRIE